MTSTRKPFASLSPSEQRTFVELVRARRSIAAVEHFTRKRERAEKEERRVPRSQPVPFDPLSLPEY
jgi:hypothetical protein